MRYIAIAALALPLQGCLFFFYVPGSTEGGNTCVGETSFVGQRIKHDDGRSGQVEKIIGRSSRCQTAKYPMLADVKYE